MRRATIGQPSRRRKRSRPSFFTFLLLLLCIILFIHICIFSAWLTNDDFLSETQLEIKTKRRAVLQSFHKNNTQDTKLVSNDLAGKKLYLDQIDQIKTIAYAVSLTACGPFLAEGAAVLKHSIKLSSYPVIESNYTYKMFVFAHPSTLNCTSDFKSLGYEVLIKETPINVAQIKQTFLREKVVQSGCCGEKEYLKLYSYTLTDYPIVVHLDLDSLVIKPLDDLFDAMLDDEKRAHSRIPVMHGDSLPQKIEAFFTRDYNMIKPGHKHVGVQGGFLVIKPNLDYFKEYKQIILEGNFIGGRGWEGKYGGYFGAQQIQGLCSYFFDGLHPGSAVELNRCIYNQMADNPSEQQRDGTWKCRDGKDKCENCRDTEVSTIKSAHFTLCAKPWICPAGHLNEPVCKYMHHKWFSIRKDLEERLGISRATGQYHDETFLGYCTGVGERSYIPFKQTRINQ